MTGIVEQGAGVPPSGPGLYCYSTLVSRNEPGRVLTSLVQGYRFANNEDEARGMAVAYTTAAKPGFGIDQVLILRVSDVDLANAAIAMEARQGRNREDGSDPKDDSAGLKGIAHD